MLWEGLGGPKGETKVSGTAGRISGAVYELTVHVQQFNDSYCHTGVYELDIRFAYMTINLK